MEQVLCNITTVRVNRAIFGFQCVIFKWTRLRDFSKQICYVFKLKLQNNLIMTSYYRALYFVIRNRRTAEDSASFMGRAAARSDQKINPQLPQVSARLHQRQRRTLWTYTVKRSIVNVVIDISVLVTNNCFSAFQACHMFKIRLKVGCSLIYLSAQLKKNVFYIQSCATSKQRKMRW